MVVRTCRWQKLEVAQLPVVGWFDEPRIDGFVGFVFPVDLAVVPVGRLLEHLGIAGRLVTAEHARAV